MRFALSYDALKMNGTDSAWQISAIRRAIRQTNFSDSITQGPRMKAGEPPPMVTRTNLEWLWFHTNLFLALFKSIVNGKGHIEREEKGQRQKCICKR